MPCNDKAKAQRAHAKRRAAERYNLQLNRKSLNALIEMIQGNQARFIERQSVRVTVWELEWENKTCRVVYDRHRKQIVTFLPRTPDNA